MNTPVKLIQELQKLNMFERSFTYGPIDTLSLGLSRFFNSDVNEYFENYLDQLDKAIVFYNKSPYKVNIDRYTLGELYNSARLNTIDSETFFIKFFESLNLITLEIIKAGLDEIYDNDDSLLKGVSSLRSIIKINYQSEHFDYLQSVITNYYITIANKPFNIINLVSPLKRFRLDTNFISSTVKKLETEVVNYIKNKYSVGDKSVYSLLTQTTTMPHENETMNKHQSVLDLIEELKQLSTLDRIGTYGIFGTLRLALSRWFNDDVIVYFENYLEKLDEAVIKFNKTEYKIYFNRTVLGELYNLTRFNTNSPNTKRDADKFFYAFFNVLNETTLEVLKAGIDEIYDNDSSVLTTGSTLKSLTKLNYSSELYSTIKDIVITYSSLVMNDELKNLEYVRDHTSFMRDILATLDQQITTYIRSKYANINATVNL